MRCIEAIDVNEAYARGLQLILEEGQRQSSRNGDVFALDGPLTITYLRPLERVLFDPSRDANPFFHLMEACWLLAGRNDARWLDRFVGDFSSRFAESDGHLHGSYGFRWRKHFDLDGEGNPNMPDQLDTAVRLLRKDPENRRVVIQMWDPVADLGQDFKDVPCNLMALPRLRTEVYGEGEGWAPPGTRQVLDLTVFNRSNDFVWGMTGANAVQFSVLQEYLAGRIGVGVGKLTQVSTNAHVYVEHAKKLGRPQVLSNYPGTQSMGTDWEHWDEDLQRFMGWAAGDLIPKQYYNAWFQSTAQPLWQTHWLWRNGKKSEAVTFLNSQPVAPDWKAAAIAWMERRLVRMSKTSEEVTHG